MNQGKDLIDDINRCGVPPGEAAFWWLGQHSFVVKLADVVCYMDPFLSELSARQVPPLMKPSEATNATLVFGSHDHIDHIDRAALPALLEASPEALLVVPKLIREKVVAELGLDAGRVFGIDVGEPMDIFGVKVHAVPAAHEFLDRDERTGLYPYLGFVVEGNGFCFYHAGDTCIYEGIHAALRRHRIDLALLPINGRDAKRYKSNIIGNMTYQEAADLAGSLRFGTTVPTHFEMFAANSVDPQLFIDYMAAKYPPLATFVPEHGKRTIVRRSAAGDQPVVTSL